MIEVIAYPLGIVLIVVFLYRYLSSPEMVAAKQRADYERAHAYKPEDHNGR